MRDLAGGEVIPGQGAQAEKQKSTGVFAARTSDVPKDT